MQILRVHIQIKRIKIAFVVQIIPLYCVLLISTKVKWNSILTEFLKKLMNKSEFNISISEQEQVLQGCCRPKCIRPRPWRGRARASRCPRFGWHRSHRRMRGPKGQDDRQRPSYFWFYWKEMFWFVGYDKKLVHKEQ